MTNFISPPSPQTPIVPTPTPTTAPIVPTPTPSTPPPTPSTNPRKRLPIILGIIGALAVVGVITAAFVFLKTEPKGESQQATAITRLRIPAALAADAFDIQIEKNDGAAAAVDTTFKVTSKVDIKPDELFQVLSVSPAQSVKVESIGEKEFRVTPKEPLKPGTVYKLAVATVAVQDDGTERNRDFSWAVQTADIFRVLSSVPGDGIGGVPIDTGIEVTLSQTGWEDPSAFVEFDPKIEGRFETHGRSLAFVPKKPLEQGRIYTVTYKKGWKLTGSDRALEKDYVIRFETATKDTNADKIVIRLEPSGSLFENTPDKETLFPVYTWNSGTVTQPVTLTGFSLSSEQGKALLTELNKLPYWAMETRNRGDVFKNYERTKVFETKSALEIFGQYNQSMIRVPAQKAGLYLVRIMPTAANENEIVEPTWVVLQLTRIATYSIADEATTLLWAMSVDTKRPLEGVRAEVEGQSSNTDQSGIARLKTPDALISTSTEIAASIFQLTSGTDVALVPIVKTNYGWGDFGSYGFQNIRTISYIFADRPLYRIRDKASFFGLAQDRETKNSAGELTILLRKSGYMDYYTFEEKVFASVRATPDEKGFFNGEISWETLTPGYYQFVIKRGDAEISSRSIEVRDIVKPAFALEVIPSKERIFAGDVLDGQVRATLFDGTPLRGEELEVTVGGQYDSETVKVTTDESGFAQFKFKSNRQTCNLSNEYVYCNNAWIDNISVRPTQGEEANIVGSGSVSVFAARQASVTEIKTDGANATISFFLRKIDLTKTGQFDDLYGNPVSGGKISGRIIERRYERVEIPGQSTYDPIEKKVIPMVRYDMKERDLPQQIALTTDAGGHASVSIQMQDGVSYRFVAASTDEAGAQDVSIGSFAKGWYDNYFGSDENSYSLEPSTRRERGTSYFLDEEVSLDILNKGTLIQKRDAKSILFLETIRGIKNASVTDVPTYKFPYRAEYIPNVTVRAVIFDKGGFSELSSYVTFDTETRELKVDITPDKKSYAPGETVNATIKVQAKGDKPVVGARVAVSTVDASLLAAIGGEPAETPLNLLYSWVTDGIIVSRASHGAMGENAMTRGGAEMGGGGGEVIRKNFKDTANFSVVTTDGNGQATISFTAPDNITSWKLTGVALTSDLYAGVGRASVPVTKPVFVDAVIPFSSLTRDKPEIKIRAFGSALTANEPLKFSVSSPVLGLNDQQYDGVAGQSISIPIASLPEGDQTLVVRVQSAKGNDAVERHVKIYVSRFTKDEMIKTDLVPGATLPDIGSLAELTLIVTSQAQNKYLENVRTLSSPWSARAEARVAGNVARSLLKNIFSATDVPENESLLPYQQSDGGIAMLPYSSSDAELSAKVALTYPDAFDRSRLAGYLWSLADDAKVTREQAIRALSGLAALGEPVLLRLRKFSEEPDLGWREKLALARGLEAAGDREASRAWLEKLLESSESRDGMTRLVVDKEERSILEETAEAAALAVSVAHPKAAELEAYLQSNWNNETTNDLDRAAFLAHILPTLHAGNVSVGYTIGGKEESFDLKDGATKWLTLTRDEAKAFRVTSATGPAAATFIRRTPGLPATVKDVGLMREYTVGDRPITELAEGMTVNVTLYPSFSVTAQDGCYVIRDHVPSGLSPLVTLAYDPYGGVRDSYPIYVEPQELGFVSCKDELPHPIKYRVRVVSKGTYVAEPAIMQSMESPRVTALTA